MIFSQQDLFDGMLDVFIKVIEVEPSYFTLGPLGSRYYNTYLLVGVSDTQIAADDRRDETRPWPFRPAYHTIHD